MYYAIKILISAVIVVIVSEFSKRSVFLGSLVASLPLISILSICWLYYETHDVKKVSLLSLEIFWLVLPSLVFFLVLPLLLEQGRGFLFTLIIAATLTAIAYFGMILLRQHFIG